MYTITGTDPYVTADERDEEILTQRINELDAVSTPRCGDFVRFADGHLERISHVWDDGVQTSEGGSFYLGSGYVSFSGGLNPAIPMDELQLSSENHSGSCWFFHHDYFTAHNGIRAEIAFRIYDVAGVRQRVKGLGREWWSDYIAGETVAPILDLEAAKV